MIQTETRLVVADNSGAKSVACIRVPGSTGDNVGAVGSTIVVAVKQATADSKVKKGTVQKAVIVRTVKEIRRADGSTVRFDDNAVVLVNKDGDPIGTRVFGPVARELREGNFIKILSLAEEVL